MNKSVAWMQNSGLSHEVNLKKKKSKGSDKKSFAISSH